MSPGLTFTFQSSGAPVTVIEKSQVLRGPPTWLGSVRLQGNASDLKTSLGTPLRTTETSSRTPPGCRWPPRPTMGPSRPWGTVQSAPPRVAGAPGCGVAWAEEATREQFAAGQVHA